MSAALLVPPSPMSSQRAGSMASTSLRRRVLQSAALEEWTVVKEAVEKEGCNVNIQEEESGLSLVHWAAHQNNVEILRWLISHGAFLRLKDRRGCAPLRGAIGESRDLLLQSAYSLVEQVTYKHEQLSLGQLEAALADQDPSVLNERMWDEQGALLPAVLATRHSDNYDAVPLLRWLANHSADLEAIDEDGNALLHSIAWHKGAEVAVPFLKWALLEAHVQHSNVRNGDGETPACLCAANSNSGEDVLACLKVLSDADVDLTRTNSNGMNVAMLLAYHHGDGPWLQWCYTVAKIDANTLSAKGRTAADYLQLYDAEESEDEADEASDA